MPITTSQQLTDLLDAWGRRTFFSDPNSGNNSTLNAGWTRARTPNAGAVPATGAGATCDNTTAGAITIPDGTPSGTLYLARYLPVSGPNRSRSIMLCDRLVHTSGLVGNVTTVQTVNSVALPTRATGGKNVEGFLEWYTATGATPTTATVIYVDDSGTSRTVTMTIPASAGAGQNEPIPFPAGVQTRGIRSVTSVQLAATTGTAGNFGVTLYERVAGVTAAGDPPILGEWRNMHLPKIDPNACLWAVTSIDSSGTLNTGGEFHFVEV